jgi:putative zinc finger/helix-turn-helix YgiT family protein
LVNIEVRHCPNCGNELLAIPRLAQLHRTIAHALILKRAQLTPQEIKFLRKSLGWSGKDFAAKMHVDAATASRWERVDEPQVMDEQNDLLLRTYVAIGKQIDEYTLDHVEDVATEKPKPLSMKIRNGDDGWRPEAAAA